VGRWRALFSVGAKTTGFFEGEDARGGCGRGAWRRSADLVRTSPSCSSARLEARRNGVARRGARRRSWGVDPDPGRRWRACGARAFEGFATGHRPL